MLNNVKLGFKITGGFLIVALIAAFIGLYGSSVIQQMKADSIEVGSVCLPSVEGIAMIQEGTQRVWVGERGLLNRRMIQPEVRKAQYAYTDGGFQRIEEGWKLYESLQKDRDEAVLWDSLKSSFEEWKNQHLKVRAMEEEKDRLLASGMAINSSRITELDNESFALHLAAREKILPVIDTLNQLWKINDEQARKATQDADATAAAGSMIMLRGPYCRACFCHCHWLFSVTKHYHTGR